MKNALYITFLILALAACSGSNFGNMGKKSKKNTPTETTDETPPAKNLEDIDADNSSLTNLTTIISELNLAEYHTQGFRGRLKIAILDNGFTGLNHSLGKRLPPDLEVVKAPKNEMQDTTHGTKMAEIVYGVATGLPFYDPTTKGPELLLLNSNGYTNFVAAVDKALAENVDMILYSQVWEYGGNLDGKGFINKEVNRATDAGILWVNAAGNFGISTYHGPIKSSLDKDIELPYMQRFVRFTTAHDFTPVRIVLAWNDFDDSKEYNTTQDLDLFLEDGEGEPLASSELNQDGETPSSRGKYSSHAREIIKTTIAKAGTYYIRVKAKSWNFDSQSNMRITVDGPDVRILDTQLKNSVLIPADNPTVLAIGASDATFSSNNLGNNFLGSHKPEARVNSIVSFDDGISHTGTSSAAAIAAGALAVFQSARGKLTKQEITALINSGELSEKSTGDVGQKAPKLRLPAL